MKKVFRSITAKSAADCKFRPSISKSERKVEEITMRRTSFGASTLSLICSQASPVD